MTGDQEQFTAFCLLSALSRERPPQLTCAYNSYKEL